MKKIRNLKKLLTPINLKELGIKKSVIKQSNIYIYFVFLILCIFYAYEFFLRISPAVLISSLLHQYHTDAFGIASFSSAYFAGYLLMQLPAGFLLDSYGFKKVISAALLTCILGTLIFTLSHHVILGLFGRFILGCGSAFAFIGAICFIRNFFQENAFAILIALVISVGTIAGAVGQVFAVNIIYYLSWHLTIDGMATWGVILTVCILFVPSVYLIRPSRHRKKLKIALPLFFKNLFQLIKIKSLWLNGLIGGLLYLPTSVIAATWGVEFFKDTFHEDTNSGSIAITALFMGWAFGGPVFSLLAARFKLEKYLISISALTAAVLIFILFSEKNVSVFMLSGALFIFGFLSSAQILIWRFFSKIIHGYSREKHLIGLASALTNLIIMLFIAVADLIMGALINFLSHHESHAALQALYSVNGSDLKLVFYLLPSSMVLASVLVLWLPDRIFSPIRP